MAKVSLAAEARSDISQQYLKKIRREGHIPAVVYSVGKESLPIKISTYDFSKLAQGEHGGSLESIIIDLKIKDGKQKGTKSTIIKEIQHDFLKGDVLHIDFNEISLTKKIHTHIPVVTVGDNIGEHHGGILEHTMRELEISCLPADLPAEVVVNVENLDMNQSIHVRDIDLGSKVEILNDPAQTVITVTMPKKVVEEEELEELVEEAAEPEVIGEKEKAAEEEQQKS